MFPNFQRLLISWNFSSLIDEALLNVAGRWRCCWWRWMPSGRFQVCQYNHFCATKVRVNYRNSCLSEEKNLSCAILAASIASSLAASVTATIACLVLGNNPRRIYANEKYNAFVSMWNVFARRFSQWHANDDHVHTSTPHNNWSQQQVRVYAKKCYTRGENESESSNCGREGGMCFHNSCCKYDKLLQACFPTLFWYTNPKR